MPSKAYFMFWKKTLSCNSYHKPWVLLSGVTFQLFSGQRGWFDTPLGQRTSVHLGAWPVMMSSVWCTTILTASPPPFGTGSTRRWTISSRWNHVPVASLWYVSLLRGEFKGPTLLGLWWAQVFTGVSRQDLPCLVMHSIYTWTLLYLFRLAGRPTIVDHMVVNAILPHHWC